MTIRKRQSAVCHPLGMTGRSIHLHPDLYLSIHTAQNTADLGKMTSACAAGEEKISAGLLFTFVCLPRKGLALGRKVQASTISITLKRRAPTEATWLMTLLHRSFVAVAQTAEELAPTKQFLVVSVISFFVFCCNFVKEKPPCERKVPARVREKWRVKLGVMDSMQKAAAKQNACYR